MAKPYIGLIATDACEPNVEAIETYDVDGELIVTILAVRAIAAGE